MPETTEAAAPNIALLEQTLDYIKAHPQEWRQEDWRCSSGMCFAGTAAMLAGGTFPFPASDTSMVSGSWLERCELVEDEAGDRHPISHFARMRLGLTDDEADDLFEGANGIAEIESAIADIKSGALR